jgi:puromycin-sensitive aminopeptidase
MKTVKKKSVRLSPDIYPVSYKISVKPDFEKFTFEGSETITLTLKKQTSEITLHAIELEIRSASFIQGKIEQKPKISFNKKSETVTFKFKTSIKKGEGKLQISFAGILNDKMRGFYRSRYEVGGKEKWIATTQFEAVDARRAFPCFDEPAMKAIFDVALIVPKNMEAISNTLPVKTDIDKDLKTVQFMPTPPMSTYLLAFIIGEFESIKTKTKEGVLVRVFTTEGKKMQARFALDVAAKTLSFYSNYFGIRYPLPVLDMIAIPDFAAGAMENWGAVTYRESALLVDENLSSLANKQWVALVVAHELAHQWFGNLVTMEWWTHLWLNEGFASYMEYLAVDSIFPSWDMWVQFTALENGSALRLDGLKNTHPIEVAVANPSEINEIFDSVSYSKGASVLRMLSEYLGAETFRKGLSQYLKKYKYGNAATVDLWTSLEIVSKKPVRKIMDKWTAEPGYPVLTVLENKNKVTVTQKRFFSNRIVAKKSNHSTLWNVPFSILQRNNVKTPIKYLLNGKSISIPEQTGQWIKVNSGECSFVRINYSENLLKRLAPPIQKKQLSAVDRLGIIRDAFALSEAGEASTPQVLNLVNSFKEEMDYAVWIEIATYLRQISQLVSNENFLPEYEKYCKTIFEASAQRVGWEKKKGEKHTDSLLRPLVLMSFGSYGDKKTIEKALSLFKKIEKGENVDPELRGVIFNLTAENGDENLFNKFIVLYKKENLQQEKDRIGRALGSFKDKKILSMTLEFCLSEHVRSQSVIPMIAAVWGNPQGRKLAWQFVKKNWKVLHKRFSGGHMLARLLESADAFVLEEDAKDIEQFFKKNSLPEASRTIAQSLEQIRSNSIWLTTDKKVLQEFLSQQ